MFRVRVLQCLFVLFVGLVLDGPICTEGYKCKKWILADDLYSQDSTEKNKGDQNDYYLDITNTGPCVVDSVMDFHAVLLDNAGTVPYQKLFTYKWHNDAYHVDQLQEADFQSNITSYMFDDGLVLPNNYTMTVCVYEKQRQRQRLIAEGTSNFTLTETLNGHTRFEQNDTIRKNPHIFATNETVHMKVHITDVFLKKPKFFYMWYIDGEYRGTGTENFVDFVIPVNTTGPIDVHVKVQKEDREVKGEWNQSIVFEDEVHSGSILNTATGMISAGDPFTLNVTFDGSNVTLCWMIQGEHGSTEKTNETCTDRIVNQHWYIITTSLPVMGYYKAHATVKNDVSELKLTSQVLYAFDPESSSSSSVAIPVIFSIIGFIIIMVGVAYVLRLRKKTPVEVANFDFHPTLNDGRSSFSLVNFKNTVQNMFSRNKYAKQHKHPKFKRSTARSYGSLNEETDVIL